MEPVRLSATKFGQLAAKDFCEFCFAVFLHIDQKAPFDQFPGIFSSIDRLTKNIVHAYFDKHGCAPAWLEGFEDATGYLKLGKLQYFDEKSAILVTGEPDDVFTRKQGARGLVDYKTARFPSSMQDEDSESSGLLPKYRVQLNVYDYLMNKNGHGVCDQAALVYFDPLTELSPQGLLKTLKDDGFSMSFVAKVLPIELNSAKTMRSLLTKVRKIYDAKTFPAGRPGCKNCVRIMKMFALAGAMVQPEDVRELADWLSINDAAIGGDPQKLIESDFDRIFYARD